MLKRVISQAIPTGVFSQIPKLIVGELWKELASGVMEVPCFLHLLPDARVRLSPHALQRPCPPCTGVCLFRLDDGSTSESAW